MAPSQAASSQNKRLFSILPLSHLLSLLSTTLTQITPRLRTPVETQLTENPTEGGVLGIVILRFTDSRKMNVTAQLRVSRGVLPGDLVKEAGLGEQRDVEGFDVVVWKKYGEPLELRRVWKALVDTIPREAIFTM